MAAQRASQSLPVVLLSLVLLLFSHRLLAATFVDPVAVPTNQINGYGQVNAGYSRPHHTGIDLAVDGDPVIRAVAAGTARVLDCGDCPRADDNHDLGKVVIIDHNNGAGPFTLYAHMKEISISDGANLSAGDAIGKMGNTGCYLPNGDACGGRLHFEVRNWGELGNRGDDIGPYWGRTPAQPNAYGYLDPRPYLTQNIPWQAPFVVAAGGNQSVRSGPGGGYAQTLATVADGQRFVATSSFGGWRLINFSSPHGPASGWIQASNAGSTEILNINDPDDSHVGVTVRSSADATTGDNALPTRVWHGQHFHHKATAAPGAGCASPWYQVTLGGHTGASQGWICGDDAQPINPSSYVLMVQTDGSGSVSSNPAGINCGADCSEVYSQGSSVGLTPTPAAGWTFKEWLGDCTGNGACNVSMTDHRNVTAAFEPNEGPQHGLGNQARLSGSIGVLGDEDIYSFAGTVGNTVHIHLADIGASFEPEIKLLHPNGSTIETDWGYDNAQVIEALPVSGTYRIVVGDSGDNHTGTYRLVYALAPGASEHGALPLNGSVADSFDAGDIDSFSFEASAGERVYLRLADTSASTTPRIFVYGPTGNLLSSDWGYETAAIAMNVPVSGLYTVVVSDYNGDQAGNYQLFYGRSTGATEGGPLTNGTFVPSTITQGDIDSFTFSGKAGETVQLRLSDNSASFTPFIAVHGPNGSLVGSDWGYEVGLLTLSLPATGDYTVFALDYDGDETGSYSLYFAKAPDQEAEFLFSDLLYARSLPLGGLETYRFTANSGQWVRLRLADASASFTPRVSLYGPTGALIDDDWGYDTALINTWLPAAGTYTVIARDYDGDETGTYHLRMALAPGANEGGELTDASYKEGTLEIGDLDTFTFDAQAGQTLQVRLADASASFTPRLTVYGPSGSISETNWGYEVAEVRMTIPANGTYTVVAEDDSGANTGAYQLHFALAPGANEHGLLPANALESGTLTLGDLETYTFYAKAGEHALLRLADASGSFTPQLYLYGPTGNQIGSNWGYAVALLGISIPASGFYTVVARDYNGDETGSYDLYFKRVPGANEAGAIPIGTVNDSIDLGDLDSFVFNALPGEDISINLVDTSGSDFAPWVGVYGPTGSLVTNRWGYNDVALAFKATAGGEYTIVVSDYRDKVGTYSLTFTQRDTDADGVADAGDNCPNKANSGQADFDRDGKGDPCDSDDDNDGVSDVKEKQRGTNPRDRDSDDDGLEDGEEAQRGTNPLKRDTDGDGYNDGEEVAAETDPLDPNSQPDPPPGLEMFILKYIYDKNNS